MVQRSKPGNSRWRRIVSSLSGVLAALILFEVGLSQVFTGYYRLTPANAIHDFNHPDKAVVEVKQYSEGRATAHFSADGARLTNNAFIEDAPVGLIIGDSHVQASQVADSNTLGSQIERMSRNEGALLNVRQYGWGGVGLPTFIGVAEPLGKQWNPKWVVVMLWSDNFVSHDGFFRFQVDPNSKSQIFPMVAGPPPTGLRGLWRTLHLQSDDGDPVISSSLMFSIFRRMQEIAKAKPVGSLKPQHESADKPDNTDLQRAQLRALRQAYGDRLLVTYLSHVDLTAQAEPGNDEKQVLALCAEEGLRCISTREVMLKERDERQRLSRGFSNTEIGTGHLNEDGHRAVAEEIWRVMSNEFSERK